MSLMEGVLAQMHARLSRIEAVLSQIEGQLARKADAAMVRTLIAALAAWLTLLIGLQTWLPRCG
jgi:hypothetical protein